MTDKDINNKIINQDKKNIEKEETKNIEKEEIKKNLKKNLLNYDDSVLVNYTCSCNNYFFNKDKISVLLPCNHFIHDECYNKLSNRKECPLCKIKIQKIVSQNKLVHSKYKKIKNDMDSIFLDETQTSINYHLLPLSMIKFTSFLNKVLTISSEIDIFNSLDYFFKACNAKINIIDNTKNNPIIYTNKKIQWKNSVDKKKNMVIISNHSHYIDSFVLYYIFRCGFVASDFINKLDLGKIIAEKCNLLIFKRGTDTNMVEKIKKYLDECKKIVIYPEGSMGNNNFIRRFRTGAFYTEANICPVVIKYKPFVWDDDYKKLIFKMATQKEMVIDVYINDLYKPPFSPEDIENIRELMCNVGNLKKSRISNKFMKE